MSALKTLAALRALEAVALYPECTLHPELARTLLDAWGARERELRRVIAERELRRVIAERDRVTAERDQARESLHDLACRHELFRAALQEARSQRDLAMTWGAEACEQLVCAAGLVRAGQRAQASRDAVLERIKRALGDACTGDLAADVERMAAMAAEKPGLLRRIVDMEAVLGETEALLDKMDAESCDWFGLSRDDLRNSIAAASERETAPQETAATNVIGDVWRTPWGHDQVVTAVGSNGFLSFGRDPVGTEHMLRCAGWAPKKARRSLKSVMDEVAAEITPAERELFDRNRAIEERMRAQETAGEAPHAVGDRVRVVRRGWCGSTLYEGEEGELVYVDHDDPSQPFFVKATDGDGRWSGGWVAEVESAEQPGTAEPGGE